MAKQAAEAAKKAIEEDATKDPDVVEDAQVVIKLLEDNVGLWDSEAEEAAAAKVQAQLIRNTTLLERQQARMEKEQRFMKVVHYQFVNF